MLALARIVSGAPLVLMRAAKPAPPLVVPLALCANLLFTAWRAAALNVCHE